jgi:tetratricopeptide (TPR) repeat protein
VLWGLALSGGALADPPITPTAIPVVAGDTPPAAPTEAEADAGHATEAASTHGAPAAAASAAHDTKADAEPAKPAAKADWVRERLLDGETPNEVGEDRSVYESRLEVARRQRRSGNQEGAIRDLIGILKSTAPNDVKRPALLEMAGIAEDSGQAGRAQQILAQYTRLFSQHPSVVEVYLRQGLLYREMGATELALAKFHGVFSSALSQRFDQLDYYRRLVLQAQTEIADTYYLSGRWDEAR